MCGASHPVLCGESCPGWPLMVTSYLRVRLTQSSNTMPGISHLTVRKCNFHWWVLGLNRVAGQGHTIPSSKPSRWSLRTMIKPDRLSPGLALDWYVFSFSCYLSVTCHLEMSAREPARMNGTLPGLCVHSTELVQLKGDSPTGYIFITLPAWLNILGSFFF